jgi:hypothetical protein
LGWVLLGLGAPVAFAVYALFEGLWAEMASRFERSRLGRRLDERAAGRPVSGLRLVFAVLLAAIFVIGVFAFVAITKNLFDSSQFWGRHFELR